VDVYLQQQGAKEAFLTQRVSSYCQPTNLNSVARFARKVVREGSQYLAAREFCAKHDPAFAFWVRCVSNLFEVVPVELRRKKRAWGCGDPVAGTASTAPTFRVVFGDTEACFDFAIDALSINTDLGRDAAAVCGPPKNEHLHELAAYLGDQLQGPLALRLIAGPPLFSTPSQPDDRFGAFDPTVRANRREAHADE